MERGKMMTLGEVFSRMERDRQAYLNSPEGKAEMERVLALVQDESRLLEIQAEGGEAALAGKGVDECPYPDGSVERIRWVYGFDHPTVEEDDEDEDQGEDWDQE